MHAATKRTEETTAAAPLPVPATAAAAPTEVGRKTVRLPELVAAGMPDGVAGAPLEANYEMLDRIGGGGMGEVYLARDRRLDRFVAVKRLSGANLANASMRTRFLREARAIAALNHIHIVHLYDMGEDAQGPYIVMEYVAGPKGRTETGRPPEPCSLADRVHRDGVLPLDTALDMIIKIGRAISYAHDCAVIHRDLKPSNVLLDATGEPKVVDFGLARVAESSARPLTMPGEKMLSLGYGAPEQESDASLTDERADVYGLGALLYFCITGKNPRYFRPNDVPEVLRAAIVKALETDREKRWDTMAAFLASLSAVKTPERMTLSSAKSTWRCKWCEAVNPVTTRYCGTCGWDGGIPCAECGSELRFGIQYCGVCGADAKAYEQANALRQELQRHRETRDFSFILQKEKQIAAFNPRGMNGRKLVECVNELAQEAGSALRRRTALAKMIERELEERQYENVRGYIAEYNRLSPEPAFEETAASLDRLSQERDRERLRQAVRRQLWDVAARNAQQFLDTYQGDHPDVERLLRRAQGHLLAQRLVWKAATAMLYFLVYLMTAAPAYRLLGRPSGGLFRFLYAPAAYVQENTVLRRPLAAYADLWRAGDMFATP